MKPSGVEAVEGWAIADPDHRGADEFMCEYRAKQPAIILVHPRREILEEHPPRRVDQQPGQGDTLLLARGKRTVPAFCVIEPGHHSRKPNPLERTLDRVGRQTPSLH